MRRVILLTGGNRGIGLAIAATLVERDEDATLLLAARDIASSCAAIEQLRVQSASLVLQPLSLDVRDNDSVSQAIDQLRSDFGRLDVLINNAGIASSPGVNLDEYRGSFQATFDTNVTSVGVLVTAFMPLLQHSTDARVVNVSSGRASMHALTHGDLPPTKVVSYSVSKVALNALTLELRKLYPGVLFQCANPGHCATALNKFTGAKDPSEGAKIVVDLIMAARAVYPSGFWEYRDGEVCCVAW